MVSVTPVIFSMKIETMLHYTSHSQETEWIPLTNMIPIPHADDIWKLEPFPSYDNSAADDFEHILSKNRKSLLLNG